MKSNRLLICITVLVTISSVCLSPLYAIPVFARKYSVDCATCHSSFPRLNDYGWQFRQNGYQLPDHKINEKTILESPPPFAMRASVMYNHDKFKNSPGSTDVNQIQLNSLDLLSAGLLAKNLGFFVVFPPELDGSRNVVAQPGSLEMASIAWTNPSTSLLNVRIGRFEPGYVAFSVKRSLSFTSYEIYDFASLSNTMGTGMPFSDTRNGIELSGYEKKGFAYTAGWTNGSGENNDNDSSTNMYLHATKVFGKGEGQTTGQRFGILGFMGTAKTTIGGSRHNLDRLGLDASLNLKRSNLALLFLQGADDKEFWGTSGKFKFSGGFAEYSYLPNEDLVGFARYDWVNLPSSLDEDIRRWTIGSRIYLKDHTALHLELSSRTQKAAIPGGSKASETFFTTGFDFAF